LESLEKLLEKFTVQAFLAQGICEVHICAFNELLASGRDPLNQVAFQELTFAAHTDYVWQVASWGPPRNPAARACGRADQRLREIAEDLRKGESEVKGLRRYLWRRLREADAKDPRSGKAGELSSVYSYYDKHAKALRAFRLTLGRLTGKNQHIKTYKHYPVEICYDLAEHVRTLIQMHDEVYLRELPRTLKKPDDAVIRRIEAIQGALGALNDYLDSTVADFRLRYQSNLPSETRVLWEDVEGFPADPLFLKCFGPFFRDYLCKRPAERRPQLAICANPNCLTLFRRKSKRDHVGKYCDSCRNKRPEQRAQE
jgi:hypothetical protein